MHRNRSLIEQHLNFSLRKIPFGTHSNPGLLLGGLPLCPWNSLRGTFDVTHAMSHCSWSVGQMSMRFDGLRKRACGMQHGLPPTLALLCRGDQHLVPPFVLFHSPFASLRPDGNNLFHAQFSRLLEEPFKAIGVFRGGNHQDQTRGSLLLAVNRFNANGGRPFGHRHQRACSLCALAIHQAQNVALFHA